MPHYLKNKDLVEEIIACKGRGNVVSDKLARMLMLFVDNYSNKPNFRYYSYVEELRAAALLHLVLKSEKNEIPAILRFDETYGERNGTTPNAFAYLTTIVRNAMIRQLKIEGEVQSLRDDIMEECRLVPSASRQNFNADNLSSEPIINKRKKAIPPPKKRKKVIVILATGKQL